MKIHSLETLSHQPIDHAYNVRCMKLSGVALAVSGVIFTSLSLLQLILVSPFALTTAVITAAVLAIAALICFAVSGLICCNQSLINSLLTSLEVKLERDALP